MEPEHIAPREVRRVGAVSGTLAIALVLGLAPPAQAYIDPGTGSMVLQLLIATALGALYYVSRTGRRVREWITRLFRGGKDPQPPGGS